MNRPRLVSSRVVASLLALALTACNGANSANEVDDIGSPSGAGTGGSGTAAGAGAPSGFSGHSGSAGAASTGGAGGTGAASGAGVTAGGSSAGGASSGGGSTAGAGAAAGGGETSAGTGGASAGSEGSPAGQGGAAVAGGAGSGASAGSAGAGGGGAGQEGCCDLDADCAGPYPKIRLCVNHRCVLPADPGECWFESDCPDGWGCFGPTVCPCGAVCDILDHPGFCADEAPSCCTTSADCPSFDQKVCVEGVCRWHATLGHCWTQADCPWGSQCQGAKVCPCGADCGPSGDVPGTCSLPVATCCQTSEECGAGIKQDCVDGVCKLPTVSGCWAEEDCQPGQTCQGVFVCPCGSDCDSEDVEGTCQ